MSYLSARCALPVLLHKQFNKPEYDRDRYDRLKYSCNGSSRMQLHTDQLHQRANRDKAGQGEELSSDSPTLERPAKKPKQETNSDHTKVAEIKVRLGEEAPTNCR